MFERTTQGSAVRARRVGVWVGGWGLENKVQIVFARANVNFCESQSAAGEMGCQQLPFNSIGIG